MTTSSHTYKDQVSGDQSELENYLTPALVDFFNRLAKDEKVKFIRECFFNASNSDELSSVMITHLLHSKGLSARYRFKIPFPGETKYPDIIIFGKDLMLLIESRIDALITKYQDMQSNNGDQPADPFGQVEIHDGWLSSQNLETGLILLTHAVPPPDNFLPSDNIYQTPFRCVTTWQDIYNWFSRYGQEKETGDISYQLARNLAEYLRDHNLA